MTGLQGSACFRSNMDQCPMTARSMPAGGFTPNRTRSSGMSMHHPPMSDQIDDQNRQQDRIRDGEKCANHTDADNLRVRNLHVEVVPELAATDWAELAHDQQHDSDDDQNNPDSGQDANVQQPTEDQ